MALEFEKWYEEKVTIKDARELFMESCLCYKVGAYRAAFLMTYLGLQNILKERMLISPNAPKGIHQEDWNKVLNDLKDDKKWDETVFNNANRQCTSNPFLINNDIRKQYEYFRCIRNDCSHAKSNIISSSHVEILWLFIQSNYSKFVINGGRNGLLERIKKHYNPVYTRPGSDVNPIVEDILTAMPKDEVSLFLKDVYELINEISCSYSFYKDEKGSDFWKSIAFSSNSDLREALYDFIKLDWEIFYNFIDAYPDKIIEVLAASSEEFVREFWNEKIFAMFWDGYANVWNVFEKIVVNSIIPNNEIDGIVKALVNKVSVPSSQDNIEFLRSIGYISEMKRKVFGSEKNFDVSYWTKYMERNWDEIRFLILNKELDYEIVSQLNRAFITSNYSDFHNKLLRIFKKNPKIKNKYKEILIQYSIPIPQSIENIE